MKQGNGRYILRLTVVLLLITVITAALLGLVNQVTADKIAEIKAQKTADAMAQVLAADAYTEITDYRDDTGLIDSMYQAGDVGYVLQATCSGSQGMITLMVGVGMDGNVTGISIIDQSETPGLGAVYAQDSEKGSRPMASGSGPRAPLYSCQTLPPATGTPALSSALSRWSTASRRYAASSRSMSPAPPVRSTRTTPGKSPQPLPACNRRTISWPSTSKRRTKPPTMAAWTISSWPFTSWTSW